MNAKVELGIQIQEKISVWNRFHQFQFAYREVAWKEGRQRQTFGEALNCSGGYYLLLSCSSRFIDNRFYKDANTFGDCEGDNQGLDGWSKVSNNYWNFWDFNTV